MNAVICTLGLITAHGIQVFTLKGIEYAKMQRGDKIYVNFSANWPKEVKPAHLQAWYVDEDRCLYTTSTPKTGWEE